MACACKGRKTQKYLWFKDESVEPVVYNSEIEAKAKVLRKGGTYIPYDPSVPIGTQINAAMSRG
jgi:acetyl-CoA carboxylase beta subunit